MIFEVESYMVCTGNMSHASPIGSDSPMDATHYADLDERGCGEIKEIEK